MMLVLIDAGLRVGELTNLKLIRDYTLLPHIVTISESSLTDIEYSTSLLKKLYSEATHVIIARVSADLAQLRRDFKKTGIKIHDSRAEQIDHVLYTYYNVRGYEDRFGIFREVAKAEISILLVEYISKFVQPMRDTIRKPH